jgi:hypothetical protein
MAFVATATAVGGWALGTGVAAGIGSTIVGGALIGAGVGGLYSAITGDGDILNSMLTGGLIGGAGAGLGSAAGIGSAAPTATATGTGATGAAASTVNTAVPALNAAQLSGMSASQVAGLTPAQLNAIAASQGVLAEGAAVLPGAGLAAAPATITPEIMAASGSVAPTAATGMTSKQMLATGLAGTAAMSLFGGKKGQLNADTGKTPSYIRPYTFSATQNEPGAYPSPYPTTPTYNAAGLPNLDTRERNYFDQTYTAGEPYTAANGGLMAANGPVERMSQNVMGGAGNMYPLSQQQVTSFSNPTQMPVSAEIVRSDYDANTQPYRGITMAKGGKTEEDDEETYKERMKRIKNTTNMLREIEETGRVSMPDLGEYVPDSYAPREPSRLNLNAMPQAFVESPQMKGVMGRVGGAYALDKDTQLMGGLSGFAGRDRGALAVRPESMDVGMARRVGPGFLSGQYQRSLTGQQPPRYMANYSIPMADGGITYDPTSQRYSGLPAINAAPTGNMTQLPPELVAQLTPQYQAANPNQFAYDPKQQRYSAATPTMSQLSAYKADQDRIAAEQAAAAAAAQMNQGFQGYAMGGNVQGYNLGGYSDGGRLLKGPGDGISDDIPATIGNKQPARLADGEFVIPARIVSELGNGSTDAGAKRLYAMMDKIQAGRKKTVGKGKVAVDSKASKHLPA